MKYTLLSGVDEVGVSHNSQIKKKVLIVKGQIPHLTQLARVKFTPGQEASVHAHPDMYEIFNVESGEGVIRVNGSEYNLATGVCITVEPGEKHEVINTGKDNLILTMIGIDV